MHDSLRPAALALALALSTLAGCASGPPGRGIGGLFDGGGWVRGAESSHAALRDGVALTWWSRGTGPARESVATLATPRGDVRPETAAELAEWCRPIDSADAAFAHLELASLLAVPGTGLPGLVLRADDANGSGGNGVYGPRDAEAWQIPFASDVRAAGGGWTLDAVALVPPWTHPSFRSTSPWRVVLVRAAVYPDGSITAREQRTLTNGEDARRFARW